MLGFAALAVDVGAGFNERRQDQSAADAAVMAGALSYYESAEDVRDQALAIARLNLDTTYSDAEWLNLWDTCIDTERPPNYQPLPALAGMTNPTINCLSIAATGYVRIRIPTQNVETTFGKVLGIDQLSTSAVAEAKLEQVIEPGGVLPFGVLGSAPNGGHLCLSNAPSGISQWPCSGAASGNYGELNSPIFGNPEMNTIADCPNNPGASILAQNIALGIDHPIGNNDYYAGFPVPGQPPNGGDPDPSYSFWGAWQMDQCSTIGGGLSTADDGLPIDTMLANTGFDGAPVQDGLVGVTDGSTFPGGLDSRLQHGTNPKRPLVTKRGNTLVTWDLDNKGLWEYLLAGSGTVDPACDPGDEAYATPGRAATLRIGECLANYGASTQQIFSVDILESPRFSFVPQFWYEEWGPGSHWQPIHSYRPIYLGGVWFNCNAGSTCDGTVGVEFFPGEDTTIMCDSNNTDPTCSIRPRVNVLNLSQISGWLIPDSAAPPEAFQGPGGNLGPFRVELYK